MGSPRNSEYAERRRKKLRKRRRTHSPTRDDYEAMAPRLLECPGCNRWRQREGYICSLCGTDSTVDGKRYDWNEDGQYFEKEVSHE